MSVKTNHMIYSQKSLTICLGALKIMYSYISNQTLNLMFKTEHCQDICPLHDANLLIPESLTYSRTENTFKIFEL